MSDVVLVAVIAGATLLAGITILILRRSRRPDRPAAVTDRLIHVVKNGTLEEAKWAMRMLGEEPGGTGSARDAVVKWFGFPSENAALARIGYRVFKWLLLVLAVMLVLLVIFAARTQPHESDVTAVIGADASELEAVRAADALTDEWVERVKDLGQLFILTPVFPLIGAVIGYIFGVRQASPANGDDGPSGPSGTGPSGKKPSGKEPSGKEPPGNEPSEQESPEIDPPKKNPPEGDPPEGHPPEGDPPEGDPPEGDPPEGHPPEGDPPGGAPPGGKPTTSPYKFNDG